MLKRNCLTDKKKKKKSDIDKKKQTIASLIEKELKDNNQINKLSSSFYENP